MVEIFLDGTLQSDLDWSSQIEVAATASSIMWHLDLGLLDRLTQPLSSPSQYQALKLSIDHFCNTLLEKFQDKTIGLCLYKGPLAPSFRWEEERLLEWLKRHHVRKEERFIRLYCQDVFAEYVDLLSSYLPEGLGSYISFERGEINDPLEIALLMNKERFPHLKLILDGVLEQDGPIAVCLPSSNVIQPHFYERFPPLLAKLSHYRMIPISLLTAEWHGLETLYVAPELISPLDKRKLQGFEAAGGSVVYF